MTTSHKKQLGIAVIVAAVAIGVISIGNSYATSFLWGIEQSEISIDEAAAIAIAHLETESSNLVEITMEKEGESFVYELEFEIDQQEVEVEIDPHTGDVLEVEHEALEEELDDDDDEYD